MYCQRLAVTYNMEWKGSGKEIVWSELYRIAIPCAIGDEQSLRIRIWLSWAGVHLRGQGKQGRTRHSMIDDGMFGVPQRAGELARFTMVREAGMYNYLANGCKVYSLAPSHDLHLLKQRREDE